jgi:uncharacterized membrane protein
MSERGFPWRTLLFLSAAANLLVIGAVAGAYAAGVRLQRESPAAVVDRLPGPRAFLAALPPETRAKMRDELAASWMEARAARQAALQARRDAFAAASAEPYDVARVRAAFARLRAADQTAIAVYHDNIVEAFGRLTPEERREALEALRQAAPAARRAASAAEGAEAAQSAAAPLLTPEQRRQARLERRRQRLQQQSP